jgi:radical SAM-linked protein
MRVRITFSKAGALRYVGNLDLLTIWERAARRAGLPLEYSHGFHPQPKINLACALPLGFLSRCELVDLRLKEDVDLIELPARLQAAMPSGIGILKAESVDDHAPPLQTQVLSAEYEVHLTGTIDTPALKQRIDDLLKAASIPRQRRGKDYDLRPLIEALFLTSTHRPEAERPGVGVFMRLSAREAATGRPEEVLAELQIAVEDASIERTGLIFGN